MFGQIGLDVGFLLKNGHKTLIRGRCNCARLHGVAILQFDKIWNSVAILHHQYPPPLLHHHLRCTGYTAVYLYLCRYNLWAYYFAKNVLCPGVLWKHFSARKCGHFYNTKYNNTNQRIFFTQFQFKPAIYGCAKLLGQNCLHSLTFVKLIGSNAKG